MIDEENTSADEKILELLSLAIMFVEPKSFLTPETFSYNLSSILIHLRWETFFYIGDSILIG